ncbi:MAG: RagB/SusD protein [Gemmatimonadetes bacterium]|nr:RagB/SusD protein [Gemmatimonadota bacterium]
MKQTMPRRLIASLAILGMGASASCVDLKEVPITGITAAYYATAPGFEAASNACYEPMRAWFARENGATMTVFGTDEYTNGADGSYKFFNLYTPQLTGDVDFIKNLWSDFYRGINTCNTVIGRASTAAVPVARQALRTAEARFMRALYLFTLVRTYGDIPLPLKETEGVPGAAVREPVAKVYDAIVADLIAAEAGLPDVQTDYGRATKPAAQHLLSLVYLTRAGAGDFAKAATEAKAVIANAQFGLLPRYKDVFDITNEKNKEVIFAIQFTTDPLTTGVGNELHLYWGYPYDLEPGMQRDLANGRPFKRWRPTPYLLGLWDNAKDIRYEDMHKVAWISNNAANLPKNAAGQPKFLVGDTSVFYPSREVTAAERAATRYKLYAPSEYSEAVFPVLNKYLDAGRLSTNETRGSRDFLMMRLAETYLIAGEALFRDGKAAEAVTFVNAVRTRAARPGKVADMQVTAADLSIDFFLDERARELTGEIMRWFDLVRTGKLVERVKLYNAQAAPNIQPYHVLRPIPNNEILLSGGTMKQNTGY